MREAYSAPLFRGTTQPTGMRGEGGDPILSTGVRGGILCPPISGDYSAYWGAGGGGPYSIYCGEGGPTLPTGVGRDATLSTG